MTLKTVRARLRRPGRSTRTGLSAALSAASPRLQAGCAVLSSGSCGPPGILLTILNRQPKRRRREQSAVIQVCGGESPSGVLIIHLIHQCAQSGGVLGVSIRREPHVFQTDAKEIPQPSTP
ncbi:hypothetical protein GCM10010428_78530 [Actinosynnema pretiosum subsp. pretiosum]